MTFWMLVVVVFWDLEFAHWDFKKVSKKITKVMMTALLGLIIILAIHAVRLDGGIDGVKFYLLPNFEKIQEVGFFQAYNNRYEPSIFHT